MKLTTPSTLQDLKAQGIYVYDFSTISGALRCPRYFQYRSEMGLSLIHPETSVSLEFGVAIHKALEHWYEFRKDDEALLIFATQFKPYEEKPTLGKSGKELDATYTVRFGCSLLDAYFNRYGGEEYTLLQNEEPVAEELIPGIYIAGRIDKILSRKDKVIYRDHKSSKYMDKFLCNPNPQFMGYKFLCEKLTGQHVSGELDMLGVSKTKDLNTLLRREPFDYSPFQMESWKKSIIHHIDFINKCREENFFPQYWRCREFFRDCAFLPLCTLARPEEHDSLVANLYETKFWDPFQLDD